MEWVLWWALVIAFGAVAVGSWRRTAGDETDRDRGDEESSGERGAPLLAHGIAVYAHEDGSVPTTAPGRCRACGTDNDPAYTYCRECLTPLS